MDHKINNVLLESFANQNYNLSTCYNTHTVSNIAVPYNNKRVTVIILTNNGETHEYLPNTKTFETISYALSNKINKNSVFNSCNWFFKQKIQLKIFT